MPLTMRATGLSSPVDKNRKDFTIYRGEWATGRVYEVRGTSEAMRWFRSLHLPELPRHHRLHLTARVRALAAQ
jgi:hypothetical protein